MAIVKGHFLGMLDLYRVDVSSRWRRVFIWLRLAKPKYKYMTAKEYMEWQYRRLPTRYPQLFKREE